MGIRSNRILSAIFLVLVLTVTVSIIMAPTAKAETVEPTATFFDVSPNPVAVGDIVVFTWDISPDPPSGYFYEDIVLSLVMPDESKQILGPFMANESGGVAVSFVPPWIGTYSATLSYPGQMLGEDDYFPFLAGPIYLDVVENLLRVHNPVTGLDYATIQDAIDAPETLEGHTILVDSGTYHENVAVTKSIALIGENSSNTIIDGCGDTSPVVNVTNLDNVEISGFIIQNGGYGLYLSGSSNATVSGNTITNNGYPSTQYGVYYGGIYLTGSSDNIISENNIRDNYYGVIIDGSSNFNTISGNNIANNDYVTIRLSYSSNNILENNIIDDNQYSLVVYGYVHSHFIHDMDTSNTVDGKPVIYWINEHDRTVPSDAGYVGLIDCMNITVQNLSLTNSGQGVLLAYTTNSRITQNSMTNNLDGIFLDESYDNIISGNNITNNSRGIFLYDSSDNTAYGNTITDNDLGVGVWQSSSFNIVSGNNVTNNGEGITIVQESNNNTVSENTLTNNEYSGIHIASSSNYNTISRNNVTNHEYGVIVDLYSNHTTIHGNTITDNELGIHIADSSDNRILHNNIIDNIYHQLLSEASSILDDGKEGNYWSNYNGTDNDGDGKGDTPYVIDENNQDNYPLIAPIHPFDAGTWEQTQYFVDCISNSTVSGFYFDPTEGAFLRFNVEGESGTSGFCRVTIPKELLQSEGDWIVLVDGASVTPTVNEDTSSTYLYFTYQHSTKTIEIRGTRVIPEFQSWALILFTLTAFAAAAAIYMLKPPKN